jgi:protein-L-isoaspartate(D-aspartate) O-methyltransferase
MVSRFRPLLAAAAFAAVAAVLADEPPELAAQRRSLAGAIEETVNRARQRVGAPAIDPRVIAAIAKVPRHEFAPPELRPHAYLDRPIQVAPDATLSQPTLVAVMTDLLGIRHGDKVLEVGVGGAYHTAILAELTPAVISVEYHAEIAAHARRVLARAGYRDVRVHVADGYFGWRPDAPYDAILVRMAVPDISSALLGQLKPGGRLIAPVGPADGPQMLVLFRKEPDGGVSEAAIMPVRFRALPGGTRL